jgi:hypothetical protein
MTSATYTYGWLNTVYLVDPEPLSKGRNNSRNSLLDIDITMQLEYVDTSWTVVSLSIGMGGIEILPYDWLVSVWLMLPPVATYLKYIVVGSSLDLAPLRDLDRGGTTTPLLLAFEGSKYILYCVRRAHKIKN